MPVREEGRLNRKIRLRAEPRSNNRNPINETGVYQDVSAERWWSELALSFDN